MAFAATDPADLTLLEAAALLRDRRLSASELLAACERRIRQRNGGPPSFDGAPGAVNAWVRRYPELAAEQARAADQRLDRERDRAPLTCGIPLALKDLCGVAGLPLTASSGVLAGHVAERDSTVWARLRDAGAVLVGHTHTHEFAAGGTTDQVGNPWALDRSPGGSSGGSAAALAAGMVPAAIGTDTAGSLRIPAALCSVSAIKPTHGRIPMDGILPLAPTLDHVGPMARTLADASALLGVLAAGDAQSTPLMPPPAPLRGLPLRPRGGDRPLGGTTIAVTDRPEAVGGVEPEVAAGLQRAREACVALGARVVEVPAVAALAPGETDAILLAEAWAHHRAYADRAEHYRTSIREFVELGRTVGTAADYVAAQQRRERLTRDWEAWFARHGVDLVLEPTVVSVAPARGPGYDSGELGGETDRLILLTSTWDLTGFPAVALPAGTGEGSGLPVGVSLIAVRGAEAPLVQAAIDLQAGPLAPPPLPPFDEQPT